MKLPARFPSASERLPPLRLGLALAVGAAVALAMSTQLLFQPFVWRNFPPDEIAAGWFDLLLQRLAPALAIALAVAAASHLRLRSALARAAALVGAILLGALAGGQLLIATGALRAPADAGAALARAVQWSLLALSVATLHYLWRRAGSIRADAQAAELRRVRVERELMQAQLQALRGQIEPHFLFNTLATVRGLHHTRPDEGAMLLAHFLDFLGSSLPERSGPEGTVDQEVALVRAYLGMVSVRMGSRLRVEIDVEPALHGAACPPLTLATLVENAIKHGIGPAPDGGTIRVQARRDGTRLELVVADTGVGFSGVAGSGVGLANIRARLNTLYGGEGRLVLAANAPSGVRATMTLPFLPAIAA